MNQSINDATGIGGDDDEEEDDEEEEDALPKFKPLVEKVKEPKTNEEIWDNFTLKSIKAGEDDDDDDEVSLLILHSFCSITSVSQIIN